MFQFPEKLQCLFEPKRYKVLYGGRGAGRSWGCARALVIKARAKKETILCAREFQNSISESVHKLLKEQIAEMGYSADFDIQKDKIICLSTGSTFYFEGIRNNTARIKSYEGITICWVEEAQSVSEQSWDDLIPTIRVADSEIWITFNPQLETDYTYKRFVLSEDPLYLAQAFVVFMNYKDNPWFPESLRIEMEAMKQADYDKYLHVYGGQCKVVLTGSIYAKELKRAYEDSRIGLVPWDPMAVVDTFWDLGRADATAVWYAQTVAQQVRVLEYKSFQGADVPEIVAELRRKPYTFGTHYLPHDAGHKRLGLTKGSIAAFFKSLIPPAESVVIIPKISNIHDGINATRMFFPLVYIDSRKCHDGLEALKNYRYEIDENGQYKDKPLHDWASDGSDAFRTMAMAIRRGNGRAKAQGLADNFSRGVAEAKSGGFALGRQLTGANSGWMGQ